MRGRDSLADHAMQLWADEGVAWLQNQFRGKGLAFEAFADPEARRIRLNVYRIGTAKHLVVLEDNAESFVSHLTVTKIILIAG